MHGYWAPATEYRTRQYPLPWPSFHRKQYFSIARLETKILLSSWSLTNPKQRMLTGNSLSTRTQLRYKLQVSSIGRVTEKKIYPSHSGVKPMPMSKAREGKVRYFWLPTQERTPSKKTKNVTTSSKSKRRWMPQGLLEASWKTATLKQPLKNSNPYIKHKITAVSWWRNFRPVKEIQQVKFQTMSLSRWVNHSSQELSVEACPFLMQILSTSISAVSM